MINKGRRLRSVGTVAVVAALIFSACSAAGTSPAASTAPVATPAPSAAPSVAGSAAASPAGSAAATVGCAPAPGTKHVSILDKDMTDDEIKAEIAKEGSLTVANWTYTATDELVNQFQMYVKATYGADIKLNYVGSQSPSEYLTKLAAAKQSGTETPYDVMAVEENYWADATDQGLVQDFLPSGLVPNQDLLLPAFQHVPTALAFQAASFIALLYNKKTAPWIKSFKDLADPRLKGKVTLPPPGDISSGGFLLALAAELGKDYKDPEQMKQVVDWMLTNIGPNVIKYTTTQSELSSLIESGQADAEVYWNGQSRLEYFGGHTDVAQVVPTALYPINGYLWIPKGAPHPVLAQTFINWRLCPDVQFPNTWKMGHGPWAELSEGLLGDAFVSHIPDWFKADYYKYYLTLDQIKSSLQTLDWSAFNKSSKIFQDYFAQKLGQ
jgi:spermidine/putrescine-binding protein